MTSPQIFWPHLAKLRELVLAKIRCEVKEGSEQTLNFTPDFSANKPIFAGDPVDPIRAFRYFHLIELGRSAAIGELKHSQVLAFPKKTALIDSFTKELNQGIKASNIYVALVVWLTAQCNDDYSYEDLPTDINFPKALSKQLGLAASSTSAYSCLAMFMVGESSCFDYFMSKIAASELPEIKLRALCNAQFAYPEVKDWSLPPSYQPIPDQLKSF